MSRNRAAELTPPQKLFVGALSAACGTPGVLVGVGVLPPDGANAPLWVVFCGGAVFVLVGVFFAVDALMKPGPVVGVAQYLMGLALIVMLALVPTWIAFGEGEREFGVSIGPIDVSDSALAQGLGRGVFGFGALILWLFAAFAAREGWRTLARR